MNKVIMILSLVGWWLVCENTSSAAASNTNRINSIKHVVGVDEYRIGNGLPDIGAVQTVEYQDWSCLERIQEGHESNICVGMLRRDFMNWRSQKVLAGSWSPLESGMNNIVWALTVYEDKLIAGGNFTTAGGVGARRIAAWNGSSWSPLGLGLNGDVGALGVYNNKLIAGGQFSERLAAWDGTLWLSPEGWEELDYFVNDLTIYNSLLIVGGYFWPIIAAWDGSSWSLLGAGMGGGILDSEIYALTVYDNKLIAGGDFFTAGGINSMYIAAWNGATWAPLGSGMNHPVVSLTVYDNRLIAGGWFDTAGGVAAKYIASWDGSSWSPLGSGMDGPVLSLAVYNDMLVAGGIFSNAGGVNASHIAAWEGSSWMALGSGMNEKVSALISYDNGLIAGGAFTTADGAVASHIARWTGVVDDVNEGEALSIPRDCMLQQNYPNPFNPVTTISFSLPKAADITIDIFNIMGQEVVTLASGRMEAGEHQLQWDGTIEGGEPAVTGIYFYRLEAGDIVKSRKMLLLK